MKKLTAKKLRQRIWELEELLAKDQLSITGEIALQAMQIALPILEQQESEGATNE